MKLRTFRAQRALKPAFMAALLLTVTALLIGFFLLKSAAVHAATPLKVTNASLIFTSKEDVSFTVTNAAANVQWSIRDSSGTLIGQGTALRKDADTVTVKPDPLILGTHRFFTLRLAMSGESTSVQFGITGPRPANDPYYGIQTLTAHGPTSPFTTDMNELNPLLFDLGFGARRDSVYWKNYESTQGVYTMPTWAQNALDLDAANGVTTFWTAGRNNELYHDTADGPYADNSFPSTPAQISAYGDYIVDFLNKNPRINKVEILNEFNGDNVGCKTGTCYAEVIKGVYPKVKAAHPNVEVIAGGYGGVPTIADGSGRVWIDDVFAAGGWQYADAWSWHPYGRTPLELSTDVAAFQAKIKALNGNKTVPIYYSENGWLITGYTGTSGTKARVPDEKTQAYGLIRTFVAPRAQSSVKNVNWYLGANAAYLDRGYDPSTPTPGFGLFHAKTDVPQASAYSPRQSAVAFYALREQLSGTTFNSTYSLGTSNGGTAYSYDFTKQNGDIVKVVWRDGANWRDNTAPSTFDDTATPVTINKAGKQYAVTTNYLGERTAINNTGSSFSLQATIAPVYITLTNTPPTTPEEPNTPTTPTNPTGPGATNPTDGNDPNATPPGTPNTGALPTIVGQATAFIAGIIALASLVGGLWYGIRAKTRK